VNAVALVYFWFTFPSSLRLHAFGGSIGCWLFYLLPSTRRDHWLLSLPTLVVPSHNDYLVSGLALVVPSHHFYFIPCVAFGCSSVTRRSIAQHWLFHTRWLLLQVPTVGCSIGCFIPPVVVPLVDLCCLHI
jgi:hypothetical protein